MSDKQYIRLSRNEEYTIAVGEQEDIRPEIVKTAAGFDSTQACLAVDANVARLQPELVACVRSQFEKVHLYEVPEGEKSKSMKYYIEMTDCFLNAGIDRQTPLFAIGGGVTGDLSGFVAASVLRGIPLVHVPTTLLAMVDSAIGGKTGINHSSGKNLIGSFYQPAAVLASLQTLETLPDEEFLCGFGEILKYGAISDIDILNILKNRDLLELRTNKSLLANIIQRSIKVKAGIVAQDTREASLRMILNYGHTFAHAIERILGYGKVSHGQAVYVGMLAANKLSRRFGAMLEDEMLEQHYNNMNIPALILDIPAESLVEAMYSDKKRKADELRFILLKRYGKPFIQPIPKADMSLVKDSWREATSVASQSQI